MQDFPVFEQEPIIEEPKNRSKRIAISVAIVLLVVVLAVASALLVKFYVLESFIVDGISMYPTLDGGNDALIDDDQNNGETLYLNKIAKIGRGDIVVFTPTKGDFAGKSLVKRVIAVGGDHVQITESAVFLNGEKLDEPYVKPAEIAIYSQPLDFYVQDGYVFCMGDNRNHSTDCRVFGPVSVDTIVGKCFLIKGLDGKLRKPN